MGSSPLDILGGLHTQNYHRQINHVCSFCMGMFLSCIAFKLTALSAAWGAFTYWQLSKVSVSHQVGRKVA